MSAPDPSFAHIQAMTDQYGTFEHADHDVPRREHGYCTDDMARLLVVATRQPQPSATVRGLAQSALGFVARAQGPTGKTRNRRDATGRWRGRHTVEDCWGRGLWGLGTAAAHGDGRAARSALTYFEHGTQQRSAWPRAMAFAALGAASVLTVYPSHRGALSLLQDAAEVIGVRSPGLAWPWPEARLTYANAVLPDAMLAAGIALGSASLVDDGLSLLDWLLERETNDGHLSVTPARGSGPDEPAHGFDQQPIEVATMADACARASRLTSWPRWHEGLRMAAGWFDGDNDAHAVMWDPTTLGAYDGLEPDGANQNQGAESTLALISTRQQVPLLTNVTA